MIEVYRDCPLRVGEHGLGVDLLPFDLGDFDLILGMDWLGRHRAVIDCHRKEIVFTSPEGIEVRFLGDRQLMPSCLISALSAHKLLRKG
ncbi:hypothetical protein, partial [Mycobacterium tuberculosis]